VAVQIVLACSVTFLVVPGIRGSFVQLVLDLGGDSDVDLLDRSRSGDCEPFRRHVAGVRWPPRMEDGQTSAVTTIVSLRTHLDRAVGILGLQIAAWMIWYGGTLRLVFAVYAFRLASQGGTYAATPDFSLVVIVYGAVLTTLLALGFVAASFELDGRAKEIAEKLIASESKEGLGGRTCPSLHALRRHGGRAIASRQLPGALLRSPLRSSEPSSPASSPGNDSITRKKSPSCGGVRRGPTPRGTFAGEVAMPTTYYFAWWNVGTSSTKRERNQPQEPRWITAEAGQGCERDRERHQA
jgi:hypothetical protein